MIPDLSVSVAVVVAGAGSNVEWSVFLLLICAFGAWAMQRRPGPSDRNE